MSNDLNVRVEEAYSCASSIIADRVVLSGYTGVECESCAAGYFRSGRGCAACACDARGAASPRCDVTGRCACRAHAAGDKCDTCAAPRTFLDIDGCTSEYPTLHYYYWHTSTWKQTTPSSICGTNTILRRD